MTKGDPVEIMARVMMIDPDEDGGPGTDLLYRAQASIAALESAGFVIVHPDQVTEGMREGAYGGIMYGGREGPIRADVLRQEANLAAFRKMLRAAPKWSKGSEG